MSASILVQTHDPLRLSALRRTAVLVSPSDAAYERLTRLAATLLCAPVALVSLIDEDQQFSESWRGLPEPWASRGEMPLTHSFCRYVVESGEPLVVEDARQHPLGCDRPAISECGTIAYLGIPLRTSDGYVLGSFCVIDHVPRAWTAQEIAVVTDLAASVVTEVELLCEIAERRHTEAALRESEERFRNAFDHSGIGMSLVAPDGRWLKVNGALCRTVGYSEEELLSLTSQDITHPDDIEADVTNTRRMLAGEIQTYQREKRYLHKAGHLIWALLTVSLVRDPASAPLYLIEQIQNISERREMEERLRQAQKMEAVARLAGGVAQDFNNLLTTIRCSAELIRQEIPSGDARQEDINSVLWAADRAAVLTGQLLTFGSRRVFQPQLTDLRRVIVECESMLRRQAGGGIRVVTTVGAGVGAVRVDRAEVEQVLTNLVVNARDAMPLGGTITIEVSDVALGADAARRFAIEPGRYLVLAVGDTGRGMDDGVRARLFEPFFTTKAPGNGNGLGLATVYGIVKQSAGHIECESVLGHGTTFRIYLPRAECPAEPAGAPTARRGTGTVLVVDDQESICSVATRALRRAGYTVHAASSGAEALRILQSEAGQIDLLLTDLVMPEMTGRELAERATLMWPGLAVVLMSGYTEDAAARETILASKASYLPKPFTVDELTTIVWRTLDAQRVGQRAV